MSGLGLIFPRRGNLAHPIAGSDYILSKNKGDPEVFSILMANSVSSDGVGITKEDAAKVTSFAFWFRSKTTITKFPECKFFGVTKLTTGNTNNAGVFYGCTNLKDIALPENIVLLQNRSFAGCSSLDIVVSHPSLETIGAEAYRDSKISGVASLGKIKELPYTQNYNKWGVFSRCTNLKYCILPDTLQTIGQYALWGCTSLERIECHAVTPPSLASTNALESTNNCPIYVPDESVDAYKSASNWSSYASRIKPLSEYNG